MNEMTIVVCVIVACCVLGIIITTFFDRGNTPNE